MSVNITSEEFKKLKELPNGQGSEGKCYFYDNNKILKVFFHYNEPKRIMAYNDNSFNHILGVNNNNYAFPEDISYIDDLFAGCITKYIKGNNLDCADESIIIDQMIEEYLLLEKSTLPLSNRHIILNDIRTSNIIYNNKFNMIDTNGYKERLTFPEARCHIINMNLINKTILAWFIYLSQASTKVAYSSKYTNAVSDVFNNTYGLRINDLLKELKTALSNYAGEEIKTVGQVRKLSIY